MRPMKRKLEIEIELLDVNNSADVDQLADGEQCVVLIDDQKPIVATFYKHSSRQWFDNKGVAVKPTYFARLCDVRIGPYW